VLLDRTDAALAAGRHAELLPGLTEATAENPLDERLAGQLILALYRSGRQADALETYRAVRERLLEDLGVDPGPALARVHHQVLTGEAELPAAPAPAGAPVPPAPGDRDARDARPASPAPQLPRRATSFVGREADVARVVAALGAAPLVTLSGVGGVGKTRLALEVAERVGARHADGVWLCELAALETGGPVSHAVATALGVQQHQRHTIEQTVIEFLRTRELLLVLDNCEHVLDAAARLVEQVVAHCRAVTVLVTSRAPLGIDGELVHPVSPLPDAEAAALFADRALAVRPDFDPHAETGTAVADICRQLDGLPLAIELAAARMRAMNAAEVADRLAGSVRIVRGGARHAPARHQSLVAAVDWSYRLLDEPERTLFARLSVFAGGFDLEAAHGVCGGETADDDTLELLAGLVEKSMVDVDHGPGATRYRLLETMRQYGRDRLDARGELDATRGRHARYLVDLTERAARGLLGPQEARWVDRLLGVYDDLRLALRWAVAAGEVDLAMRLVAGLPDFAYWRVGYELADWAEDALALPGAAAHPLAGAVRGGAARGAWCLGDYPRATRLARASGPAEWVTGAARCGQPGDVLAVIAGYRGRIDEALSHYRRQVELGRLAADPLRLNWALFHLAMCRAAVHEPLAGQAEAEEALALARTTGNPTGICLGLLGVGRALQRRDPETALAMLDESAEVADSVRNRWFAAFARMYAAATRAVHAEPAVAAAAFVRVLDDWERLGDWSQQWLSLTYTLRLLERLGADEDAVVLQHALVGAGLPAPTDGAGPAALVDRLGPQRYAAAAATGSSIDGAAVVAHVRAGLRAHAEPGPGEAGTGGTTPDR
jgi:predicted ATPase